MNDLLADEPRNRCDGQCLKALIDATLAWLEHNHTRINALNVFPVPDGDTGTNMLLTMRSAQNEIAAMQDTSVGNIARALSHGALMGARGNSGVILSQLWRGFARALEGEETLDTGRLAGALREASSTAYKGVIKPVEGTILTVSREIADAADAAARETDSLVDTLEHIVAQAHQAVAQTPEQLPVLKQAGVVDSGGMGLAIIFEGMLMHLQGRGLELPETAEAEIAAPEVHRTLPEDELRRFPYDVQFLIRGQEMDVARIRADIDAMGASTLVVGDAHTIKVHVHVSDPGIPISYGVQLGAITDIVVENMQEQAHVFFGAEAHEAGVLDVSQAPVEVKAGDIAVVAVVSGSGLIQVYQSLGVGSLVAGGQTMNPSTEELLRAIRALPTDRVIVLPNNKNILMAAQQAAAVAGENGEADVRVVPTVTLPQGISALMAFDPEGELDAVAAAMQETMRFVKTAEVTTATRSVEIDGVTAREGQNIGLLDGTLVLAGDDLNEVVFELLRQMQATIQYELVTLYYGNGVTEAQAESLAEALRTRFTEQEVEVIPGGQPHYHYILSTE